MTQRIPALAAVCVLLIACGTPDDGDDLGLTGGVDAGGCTDECSSAVEACDGDTAVVCAVGADGCLAETRTACDGEGESCEDGACVVDPCAAVEDPCFSAGESACVGNELVECVLDENECAVEMRTDCGATEGGFCDPQAEMCRGPFDPCADLDNACAAAGASCDGDTAVVCAADAFRCLAEERIDCAAEGLTCDAGRCVGDIDCTVRDGRCFVSGNTCDGPVLVQCQRDAFGCLTEQQDDCTDLPEGSFGVCDPTFGRCRTQLEDPCPAEPDCPAEAVTCENVTDLVICARSRFGCLRETRIECGRAGEACSAETISCEPTRCGPAPTVLDCDSGTVRANTAMGSDAFDEYACLANATGREAGWQLEIAEDARVTLTATPVATAENFDLVVLDGEASGADCAEDTPCLAQSSSAGATESVTVDLRGGDLAFVFYDGVDATGTVEVDLEVSCAVPACGDGVVGAFEECDDGGLVEEDGCSAACTVEPAFDCAGEPSVCTALCGNGRTDPLFESCDDGNDMDGDGCSACALELPTTIAPLALTGRLEVGDGLWERATDRCAAGGDEVLYDAFYVANSSATERTYAVVGEWTGDRAIHVFEESFDDSLPTVGCLSGAVGTGGASLAIDVPAGGRRVVVISQDAGSSGTSGTYDITIAEAFGISATATMDTVERQGTMPSTSRFEDACPAGELVVGLDASLVASAPNNYLGQLALVCGAPLITSLDGVDYEVRIGAGTRGLTRGRGMRTPASMRCPNDTVAQGFEGRAGWYVDRVVFDCVPLTVTGSPGTFVLDTGAVVTGPTLGGSGGNPFASATCPADEVARGTIIRASNQVEGFGFSCGTVSVP